MKTDTAHSDQTEATDGLTAAPASTPVRKSPSAAAGRKADSPPASTEGAGDKPTVQTWPFPAGSQGDNKPLPSRPVQKPGWNARQFRI
ncbi:MAG: hypothetical protein EOO54_10275 [Haliea sp.]|nr:MAG: hypothetical protein EOO54_10275 [Haliea sp.]